MRNLTLALTLLGLSCSTSIASRHSEPTQAHHDDFKACDDTAGHPELEGSLCAEVQAPLRYDRTDSQSQGVSLFVRKIPARGPSQGSVWFIAGGPGESGSSFYPLLERLRAMFPHRDFYIPDHRGTGYSTRICPAEESIKSPGGLALEGAEWGSCMQTMHTQIERTKQFSLTHAAHDLGMLIHRFKDSRPVYVYSVSYGTQLVLRAQAISDLKVQGIVLDSLVPVQTDAKWDLSQRSQLVHTVGQEVLAAAEGVEPFKAQGSAESALRRLLQEAARKPKTFADLQQGNLKHALGGLLDHPAARSRLPFLIDDLLRGGRREWKAIAESIGRESMRFTQYRQAPFSVPLAQVISASENTLRPRIAAEQIQQEESSLLFASPLPRQLTHPSSFPSYEHDGHFGQEPQHLPPTLVLQGTWDPKTSHEGALAHARLLKSRGPVAFVSVTRAPHIVAAFAPSCAEVYVRKFLATVERQERLLAFGREVSAGTCEQKD